MMFSLFTIVESLLLLSTVAALSSVTTGSKAVPSAAQVWDDVLTNEDHRAALHAYASKSGLEHKCFTRPLATSGGNSSNNNIIERTLDVILAEIDSDSNDDGDGRTTKQYVEYWTRQEWRHIEAHADVDENLSKQMDRDYQSAVDSDALKMKYPTTYKEGHGHRYPLHGHVLYLNVGSSAKGPTCVFNGRSSGGDLLQQVNTEALDGECSDDTSNHEKEVQLTVVPAVPGRLLRFDGRDLHAVPRPTDVWMLPFVRGAAEHEPEDVWGRSVILFNVWPGDEDPPLGVPLDAIQDDTASRPGDDALFCNPFESWRKIDIAQKESAETTQTGKARENVKVWLLGNERRRDHAMRTLSLLAPRQGGRDAVREALSEQSQVTELRLRQP